MKYYTVLFVIIAGGMLCGMEYRFGFSAGEPGEWKMSPFAETLREGKSDFVRLTVAEADKAGQNMVSRPFAVETFRGRVVDVRCRVRAGSVSEPPAYYNGIKVMMSYDAGGGPNWKNVVRVWGSFDWKEVGFSFRLPEDAKNGVLYLGLQDSSGTVDFTDLRVTALDPKEIFPPPAALPGNYRAEYTKRVSDVPRLRGAMSPDVYRKGDLDALASWGANLVRWQVIRNWGATGTDRDLADYDAWIDSKLDEFELVLADCERLKMKVIFDLHSPPGGRNADRDMAMFHEKEYADAFVEVWRKIARRFKERNSAVFGYNLVNEPQQRSEALYDYLKLQYLAAQAVREIDPDIPIIIESNMAASAETFEYLTPLPLKDVIYQVHMYYPGRYTHQNIGEHSGPVFTYPGAVDGVKIDREELENHLEAVRRFQQKHGARIYAGEFSAARWAPGAERYLADCISIFEEYGWDWTYHAFRESDAWDAEIADTAFRRIMDCREREAARRKSGGNPRLEVLRKAFRKNRPASQQDSKGLNP